MEIFFDSIEKSRLSEVFEILRVSIDIFDISVTDFLFELFCKSDDFRAMITIIGNIAFDAELLKITSFQAVG